jgi:hypothetical protein
MRLWLACGVAFCGLCAGVAQVAPPIAPPVAILTVAALQKSYRLGDVVILKTTTTNISRNDICFEPSSQAAFEVQLYDLQDRPGIDRALLAMPEMWVANVWSGTCPTINPGRSEKRNVALNMPPKLITHAGLYKIMVGRKEVGSNRTIWANPVVIRITLKDSAASWDDSNSSEN